MPQPSSKEPPVPEDLPRTEDSSEKSPLRLSPRQRIAALEEASDEPDEPTTGTIKTQLTALSTSISIPLYPATALTFGTKIAAGGFGSVGNGTITLADSAPLQVAIKIVRAASPDEVTAFIDEARASWLAGGPGRENTADEDNSDSTICATLGISYDYTPTSTRMLLIMEKLDVHGDLHDVIHTDDNWEQDPTRIRPRTYACTDSDGDYMLYTMPRVDKISFATQIARGLRELRVGGIVHNDIKPGNVLVMRKRGGEDGDKEQGGEEEPKKKKRKKETEKKAKPAPARCRIRFIDFGVGGTPDTIEGYAAGTDGYMAPEVADYGDCTFKSDIFSAGVCILEVWMGQIFPDVRANETVLARDRVECLRRLNVSEPAVAELLRRCLSADADKRPSAKTLQTELVKIRKAG